MGPHLETPATGRRRCTLGGRGRLAGIAVGLCLLTMLALAVQGRGTSTHSVTIPVGDGGQLSGLWLTGAEPADRLVITAHGGLASKETTLAFCREARARGADCLAVDLPAHGASRAAVQGGSCAPMSDALAVLDRPSPLGQTGPTYPTRVFIGHSLGAALGGGVVFPCSRSSCVGNPGACGGSDAVILGDMHRTLGLPDTPGYLLSHVLEPWSPAVVDRALSRHLPPREGPSRERARRSIAGHAGLLGLLLLSASLAGALTAGLVGRAVRRRLGDGPMGAAVAGGAGGAVLLVWMAVVAGRRLWWLWPTQPSDLAVGGAALAGTLLLGGGGLALLSLLRRGAPPGWGSRATALVLGVLPGLVLAVAVPALWGGACLSNGVIVLVPPLMAVVAVGVMALRPLAGWRVPPMEILAFCGWMMAWMLALLTPGF